MTGADFVYGEDPGRAEPAPPRRRDAAAEAHAAREKFRLRFAKHGALRFVGHNDTLRLWQRLFRRAGLPLRQTEGFHPRPALSSPVALGLGIEGRDEPLEFELAADLPDAEVEARIRAQLDPGLELVALQRLPRKTPAAAVAAEYAIAVPPAWQDRAAAGVAAAWAAPSLPVERRLPGKPPKRLDVKPYLEHAALRGDTLEFRLAIRPDGAARPEEFLDLVGLRPLLDQGSWLVRTRVELASTTPAAAARPPAATNQGSDS